MKKLLNLAKNAFASLSNIHEYTIIIIKIEFISIAYFQFLYRKGDEISYSQHFPIWQLSLFYIYAWIML